MKFVISVHRKNKPWWGWL